MIIKFGRVTQPATSSPFQWFVLPTVQEASETIGKDPKRILHNYPGPGQVSIPVVKDTLKVLQQPFSVGLHHKVTKGKCIVTHQEVWQAFVISRQGVWLRQSKSLRLQSILSVEHTSIRSMQVQVLQHSTTRTCISHLQPQQDDGKESLVIVVLSIGPTTSHPLE